MEQIQFTSTKPNYCIGIPATRANYIGERIYFVNGKFTTDDARLIEILRDAAKVEARSGAKRNFEEACATDSLRLTGLIHLELNGVPYTQIQLVNNSLMEMSEKVKNAVANTAIHQSQPEEKVAVLPVRVSERLSRKKSQVKEPV